MMSESFSEIPTSSRLTVTSMARESGEPCVLRSTDFAVRLG